MPRNFINWSCKLTLCQREWDGGGGQPPVKSEVRAQSNKVGRLCFWGVDAWEYPGGLLRLDPAFVYAEPPFSWPLSWVKCLSPAPSRQGPFKIILLIPTAAKLEKVTSWVHLCRLKRVTSDPALPSLSDPYQASLTGPTSLKVTRDSLCRPSKKTMNDLDSLQPTAVPDPTAPTLI